MSAFGSKAALREGVAAVTLEAGGALNVFVVRHTDAPGLIRAACEGDAEALGILQAVNQAQAGIMAAPTRQPMLCASCPDPLRDGQYAFVIAMPAKDSPTHALGLAVCKRCGRDTATIKRKGTAALARIWPDLREISVSHPEGGRA